MKSPIILIHALYLLAAIQLTSSQDCNLQYQYIDKCLSPTSQCFQCIPCWTQRSAHYINPRTQRIQKCPETSSTAPDACRACTAECERNVALSDCPAAQEAKLNLRVANFVFASNVNRTEHLQCPLDTAIFMIFAQYHESNVLVPTQTIIGQNCNENLLGKFAAACNGKSNCSTLHSHNGVCSGPYTLQYGYYCSPYSSGTFPPVFVPTTLQESNDKIEWWWVLVSIPLTCVCLGMVGILWIRCLSGVDLWPKEKCCCRQYERTPNPANDYERADSPPPREGVSMIVPEAGQQSGARYQPGRSGFSHELESIPSGVSGVFDGSNIGHSIPKNLTMPAGGDVFSGFHSSQNSRQFDNVYDQPYAVAHEMINFEREHNPVAPWEQYHVQNNRPPPGAVQPWGAVIHGVHTPKSEQALAPDAAGLGDIEEINRTELTLIQEIGKGSFGRVFRARFRDQIVAAKKFRRDDVDEKKVQEFIKHEIKLSHQASGHPNVLKAYGYCQTPFCLVTECMDRSVRQYLDSTPEHQITMKERAEIALQAARGVLHLHSLDIIHRDIAARNLLLKGMYSEGNLLVVVSDFGMSKIMTQESYAQTYSAVGPLKWMAPEAIKDQRFSLKSDVYAYGITLWEIITGRMPYEDIDAVNTAVEVLVRQRRPELKQHIPQGLCELMKDCWQNDPSKRPEMENIINRLEEFINQL